MNRKIRGSGLRYTLPFLFRFAGLWLVVTVTAVLTSAVSSYLAFAARVGDEAAASLRNALTLQTVLSILAVVGLAVFTTHRLAGPWIAIKRALDAVRDGDLETGLRMRASDPQVLEVQIAFDQMLDSLRRRLPAE